MSSVLYKKIKVDDEHRFLSLSIFSDETLAIICDHYDVDISILKKNGLGESLSKIISNLRFGKITRRCFDFADLPTQIKWILHRRTKSTFVYFLKQETRIDLVFLCNTKIQKDKTYYLNALNKYNDFIQNTRYKIASALDEIIPENISRCETLFGKGVLNTKGASDIFTLVDSRGQPVELSSKQRERVSLLRRGCSIYKVSQLENVSYGTILSTLNSIKAKTGHMNIKEILSNIR